MKALVAMATIAAAVALLALTPQIRGQGMGPGHPGGMGGMGGMMAPPPSIGKNPLKATQAVVAKGKSLYDANCVACHGAGGRGDGPAAAALNPRPPDMRAAKSWSDGQIAAQIKNGRGIMPPFGQTLDSESIWSLVHYVRRLQR